MVIPRKISNTKRTFTQSELPDGRCLGDVCAPAEYNTGAESMLPEAGFLKNSVKFAGMSVA